MSFTSDTEWPRVLQRLFEVLKEGPTYLTKESRYYAGYNSMLHHCFRDPSRYTIAPQTAPPAAPRVAIDYMALLVAFDKNFKPVLFVGVKDDNWLLKPSSREVADSQMRQCYDKLVGDCPLTKLYGISFIGTKMRVYAGNVATNELTPPEIPHLDVDRELPADYLEGGWPLDVLSPEGFAKMQEVIGFIRHEGDSMIGNP